MRTLTIISAILFTSLFSGLPLAADEIRWQEDAPDRYQVVPGDTLWGIASRFLREPWRWPEIWQMNREQIRNPHRIYPGDVIVVENGLYGRRLRMASEKGTVRLSPRIHAEGLAMKAIPGIPAEKIEPFLSQPLVIEKSRLDKAPVILGTSDDRMIMSPGNKIYVGNMPADQGVVWQVFRNGKALIDPDHNNRALGYEAIYLGTAEITDFAEISTARISRSVQEILKGDRLLPLSATRMDDYLPHAPDFPVTARIISVYGGVREIGENMIVTLNQGSQDGIEPGHVLAVYHEHSIRSHEGKRTGLPDERIGLALIFRVFDSVSYALVMQSTQAIKVMDTAKTP